MSTPPVFPAPVPPAPVPPAPAHPAGVPPAPIPAAITAKGLRKAFGEHAVLSGVDFTVDTGSVFALLGSNGAGKSTTVNILSTLIHADGGSAQVAGHDITTAPADVRGAIGVTGQFSAVDTLMTGTENLLLMARLHHLDRSTGRRRAAELMDTFGLQEAADRTAATYSGGMRRKLDLAMTLVGRPAVVFLDEPTAGLDPRSRRAMWQIVRDLAADGVTIMLTTQYLEEADQLADRIAVLEGGVIVANGTPADLKRLVPGGAIRVHLDDAAGLQTAAVEFPAAVRDDDALTLDIAGAADLVAVRDVLGRLTQVGVTAGHLEVRTPDLDDVFLSLTGNSPAGDPRKAVT